MQLGGKSHERQNEGTWNRTLDLMTIVQPVGIQKLFNWPHNYFANDNLLFSRRHPAQVVVVEAFAPEVGTRGDDDQRAVEAWAGRAVNVVHEALAGLDRKGDSEEAVASSYAALKVKLSCQTVASMANILNICDI